MGSQTQSEEVAIVDFTNENMKQGTDTWLSACHVVRSALEDHGCFVARFDKISKELSDSVAFAMDELFGLPVETKAQETSDKLFHGYFGQAFWLPLYESLGIDDPLSIHGCQKFAYIMWPQGNKILIVSGGEKINKYAKLLGEVDHMAKRVVFDSYGLDMQECDSLLESTNYLLRCFKHRVPQMDENNLGIDSHTDMSIISILHQLSNLNGLEIKMKNGEWTGISASPSFMIVLAGDAFQVWSNGRIRTCEHKVIMNAKKTRYSMGLFSFMRNMMKIPEELIDEQHPLRYKPIFDHYDYLHFQNKVKIKEPHSRIKAYCGICQH